VEFDPGLRFDTAPGVYPPREDSHLLLSAVSIEPGERVLELGAGSGLVALHAGRIAKVVATDVNPESTRLLRRNATANRIPLAVVRCDLFRGLRAAFDVVAFNPPYLIEKIGGGWVARAWQGGVSGEDVILRFLEHLPGHLAEGGRAYVLVPTNRDGALVAARERFAVEIVAKRALFFETLLVLRLSHRR